MSHDLPGDWDPAGSMVVTVKCGEMMGDISTPAFQQDNQLPKASSSEVAIVSLVEYLVEYLSMEGCLGLLFFFFLILCFLSYAFLLLCFSAFPLLCFSNFLLIRLSAVLFFLGFRF